MTQLETCRKEAHAERNRREVATLSPGAADALYVFTEASSQKNYVSGMAVALVGMRYEGVESVCRALDISWPDVFPFIRALEAHLVSIENQRQEG